MKFFAVFLLAVAVPTPEIRYFQYQRPVQLPPNASGQVCAVLDASTFTHAAPGLPDLRLYRGAETTPYVIQDALSSRSPAPSIEPINLGRKGGKTVFDAAMPEGPFGDIQLTITGENFLATVNVSGSQTQNGAATRIGSYTIFDFTSQRLGRSTILHLPKSDFRFLHFEVGGPIAPEHITGLVVAPRPQAEPRYITVADQLHFVQKGRDSVAEFVTPAQVPIDRILFVPANLPVNFSRSIEIKVSSAPPVAPNSAQSQQLPIEVFGELLRIHRAQEGYRIDEEQLATDIPQVPFTTPEHWTITVHNGDDAPIQLSNVVVQMLERDLCFEAAAAAQYTLYYGDKALPAPRYDYAAWFAPRATPPAAALGPEQSNASYQLRPDSRPFTERHPSLLWIALIVVVLLLGVIALRTAKRIEAAGPMP